MDAKTRETTLEKLGLEQEARERMQDDESEARGSGREAFRHQLAEANRAVVFERQIGESDLLRVNYLERGLRASRAVCRIDVRDRNRNPVADGTGFLIAPRLLMTNAHVLLDEDEARNSLAEFDYEDDIHSIPKQKQIFRLRGDQFLFRDPNYDVAVVAVEPVDIRGEQGLDHYGYLSLRATSGKALNHECVSIIQHPNGRSKEIACRANRVIRRTGIFIHYTADTDPGSSGSPVFSDEWELVALHHAGVRAVDDQGRILNKDRDVWHEEEGEERILWEANEGIRISEVVGRIEQALAEEHDHERQRFFLDAIRQPGLGVAPYIATRRSVAEERRNTAWYAAAEGYDPDFLGGEAHIELPDHTAHSDASAPMLYRNFSLVMKQGRRQALFTACNIDGTLRVASTREIGWKTDPRLDARFQLENDFYKDQAGRTNRLDRGHLVKRTDPSWGDLGAEAIDDTFHWTNSALQHRSFNNGIWGRLEDALEGRFVGRTIMTVFTGPIFRQDDPEVVVFVDGQEDREQIALDYWKVIAFADAEGFLAAAGFRQSQAALVRAMDSDFTDESDTAELLLHQVPIREIEQDIGLVFHDLSDFEATDDQLESRGERWRREIRGAGDFLLTAAPGTRRVPTRLAQPVADDSQYAQVGAEPIATSAPDIEPYTPNENANDAAQEAPVGKGSARKKS